MEHARFEPGEPAAPGVANDGAFGHWPGRFMQMPLVRHLAPRVRGDFFSRFDALPVDAGVTLSRQGEPATLFQVVASGSCELLRLDAAGTVIGRRTAATGGYFGLWSLLSATRADCTLRMTTPGLVMSLPLERLRGLLIEPGLEGVTRLALPALRRRARFGHVHLQIGHGRESSNPSGNELRVALADLRRASRTLDRRLRYSVGGASWRDNCAAAFLLLQAGITVWGIEDEPAVAVLAPARGAPRGAGQPARGSAKVVPMRTRDDLSPAQREREQGAAPARL